MRGEAESRDDFQEGYYSASILGGVGLPLNESEISRRHAEVTFDPRTKKFYITDLHSTNGVAINAKNIQPDIPHEISPGVHIQLGPSVIVRFEI